MAADLFDRVRGVDTDSTPGNTKISEHDIFSMLVALADGELTRAQIEVGYDIPTTGAQATDLDFLIDTYTGITGGQAETRQEKYLNRIHASFMLSTGVLRSSITKADIQTWLTNAAA
jgi:hypothetical protein